MTDTVSQSQRTKINKQIEWKGCHTIFHANQMRLSVNKTQQFVNDPLFFPTKNNNKRISHWVLAVKFFIALNIKLDHYAIYGLDHVKIPQNMHFYIDIQQNICAIIYHSIHTDYKTDFIIEHCKKMSLVVMESYIHEQKQDKNNINVTTNKIEIIRVPISYYNRAMNNSFYEFCCNVTHFMLENNDNSNPLFMLFLRTISNFDCFHQSIPFNPLSGSLNSMFRQFAIGICDWNDTKKYVYKLSQNEFISFLGCYDCWSEINKNKKIKKILYNIWDDISYGCCLNILKEILLFIGMMYCFNKNAVDYIKDFTNNKVEKQQMYQEQLRNSSNGNLAMYVNLD